MREVLRQTGLQNVTATVNQRAFTHGSSDQRMKWLKLGLTTGDMSRGNTFSVPESQL